MSTAVSPSRPSAVLGFWRELRYLAARYPLGVGGGVIMAVFVFAAVHRPAGPFHHQSARISGAARQ
jgi:hypothetical protein